MATTSIWRVKGWLGKVVIYAENPEKTANPKFYADRELTEQDGQQLSDVIRYAVNSEKTQETGSEDGAPLHRFVSGINCSPATARDEMLAVKKRFGKEDGTVAYHGYQSFAPGEATPELAHEIGVKLATRLWGDRYQVIVATHLDKENHLHNHFVVNTVSFADGIKYHRTRKDYHEMQTVSDKLCREYGLSVIEHPQQGRGKQYGEWRAEQEQRPTWRGLIRADIDEAIRQSMTERQFFDALRKKGYAVKVGKDISVRPPGKERFVRLMRNFGENYSLNSIRRRILSQSRPEREKPKQAPEILRVRLIGSLKTTRKLTGFRALYAGARRRSQNGRPCCQRNDGTVRRKNFGSENQSRDPQLYGIHVFRAVHAAVRFFCLGDPRRRGTILSAEAPLWDGNRQLDVYSRCRTLCGAGLYHLSRHDRRAISQGVAALGAVRAERASL